MRSFLLAVVLVLAVGCSSDGPKMSGFGLGKTRMVKVGQIVELRLPLREDGSRNWRVTEYDSLYLTVAGRPTIEVNDKGEQVLVLVTRAKTPGRTEVEVTEMIPRSAGRAPRIEKFKVEILE